jgi:arylsulfatase A
MSDRGNRPNIVLVLTDDLGIGDIGAYGGKLIKTPSIDRLAATGVVCDAMYAAAATDTPSRAGMLLGRYGARYNLPSTTRPNTSAGLPADATTFATALQSAGYATGLFGQWRLGSGPGQHPLDHGFDRFSGTLHGTDVAPLAWYEGRTVIDADYDSAFAARQITEDAMAFIDADGPGTGGSEDRRPFLAVLSHLAPHAPYRAEPGFFQRSVGLYGDVVEQIDHYVGVLVRHLEGHRPGERTLVIVTSDNGPRYEGRTQARRGRKPEVFDGGVRVPFLASWLTAGRRVRDRVPRSLLDLTPSLCALAGVTAPGDLDGEDLSPLLLGREAARGPVFLYMEQRLNAMRKGKWKLHTGFGPRPGFGQQYMPQLYDVEADHRENYSVANLHPDLVTQLGAEMEAVRVDVAAEAAARAEGGTA